MGRIKKAAADKHGATLPPVLSEFVSSITNSPICELPQRLESFPHHWPFPRGDLYHWISVLDLFDDILGDVIKLYNLHDGPQTIPFDRRCLFSKFEAPVQRDEQATKLDKLHYDADGDRRLVESVLRFSRRLMDNCGNRSLYNSSERLHDLLNTTSLPLLLEVLRLASRLALRYNFSRVRSAVPNLISSSLLYSHYNINLERVQRLAEPFSRLVVNSAAVTAFPDGSRKGKEKLLPDSQERQNTTLDPNDFMDILREDIDEQAFAELGSVSLSYYQPSMSLADGEDTSSISDDKLKSPTTPTPARRSSGFSKQQKPQDTELSVSPEKQNGDFVATSESGHKSLKIDSMTIKSSAVEDILKQYLPQLPESMHFEFSSRVVVAKAIISGQQARLDLIEMRLLAIMNLAYIYPERDFQNKLLAFDSDEPRRLQIVNQLADMIRPTPTDQSRLPLSLKTTAISTLEALSKHKSRFGDVCAALQINVNHGIIFQILHEAIADLAQDDTAEYNEQAEDWRDALLSLLEILPSIGSNARTAETLIGAGFFDMLVKELELRSVKAERVHYKALMFIINISHMVRDALQTFANCKGFDVVSDLLAHEVQTAVEDVKAGKTIPEAYKSQIMDYQMSFFKQQTLRWLFKFINSMLSQQGGNVERLIRNLIDSPPLLAALRQVIENAKIFGSNTWSGAIGVLSSFIHNEPTSYAVILEAGLSKTFLESVCQTPIQESVEQSEPMETPIEPCKVLKAGRDSIKVYNLTTIDLSTESVPELSLQRPPEKMLAAGILPATDPIIQIPNAFGALCLNPSGLDLFLQSNVLEAYFEIFESPAHVKILAADVSDAKTLGNNFDELIRHHPRLKHVIVRAVVVALARVSYLVNNKAAGWTGMKAPLGPQDNRDSKQPAGPSNEHNMSAEPVNVDERSKNANRDEPTAADYLSVMINFLTGFCENNTPCTNLIQAGAVEFLLDLATARGLPYNFNSRSESIELTRLFHMLIDNKAHLVLPTILIRLETAIAGLQPLMNHETSKSLFWGHINSMFEAYPVAEGGPILITLVTVHTLVSILQDSLSNLTMSSSRNSPTLFIQVNLVDHWSSIVEGLLKIQPTLYWEEVLLQKGSKAMKSKVSPSDEEPSTEAGEADPAPDVREDSDADPGTIFHSVESIVNRVRPTDDILKRRLRWYTTAVRYLLSQVPLTTTAMLHVLAKSLVAKRKYDHYVRQNSYKLAGTIVKCYMDQLLDQRALADDDLAARSGFFIVILRGFKHLIIEPSSDRNHGQCMTLLLIMFKRHEYGLSRFNAMLDTFLGYVKNSQEDKALESSALDGMKIVLDFYSQLVNSKYIVDAMQSQSLQGSDRERDREGYYYFSASQLLIDLRVKILTAVKPVWDSVEVEKATVPALKSMMDIFRTIFECDNETGSRKRSDGPAMIMQPESRSFHVSRERLAALQSRGTPEDLAREALFRVVNNPIAAEEYCDMHLRHVGIPRVPPPESELRRESSVTSLSTPAPESGLSRNSNASELSNESSPVGADRATTVPVIITSAANPEDEAEFPPITLAMPTSMELDADGDNHNEGTRNEDGEDEDYDDENGMAMSIDNQLVLSESAPEESASAPSYSSAATNTRPRMSLRTEKLPAPDVATIDELNTLRQAVRKDLVDRLLDIMSSHEGLTFDIADLIISSTKRASDADEMRKDICTTLMESLLSFMGADFGMHGKKIADICNLLAVVLQSDDFYKAAGSELRGYFTELITFFDIPTNDDHAASSFPWISQLLLLLEKLLAEDDMPIAISWTAPIADSEGNYSLPIDHGVKLKVVDAQITVEEKSQLLEAILRILPHVNKDAYLGISIVRILVILTRSRKLAEELGKKHNLQRLFLMVKQLAGIFDLDFQKTFILLLRHIIEDEEIIKEVMRGNITAYWTYHNNRPQDLSSYTKLMPDIIIRAPDIFVSVTSELVEIVSSETNGRQYMLAMKDSKYKESTNSVGAALESKITEIPDEGKAAPVKSATATAAVDDPSKPMEMKIPIQEKPDGVIHWLLSQLLQYKDVEDKEIPSLRTKASDKVSDDISPASTAPQDPDSDSSGQTPQSANAKSFSDKKSDKAEWIGEQHPHFHYRCFLMETLTELLYSYKSAKLEFVNFKQDNKSTTASALSKPRPAVLNYLLTRLIPVGTLEKVESTNMKKKDAQSQWAISLIVALCLKASHIDDPKNDDNDLGVDNDLTYIRKFVLESSLKAFKDATAVDEPLDSKYGRLLNLADLFCRLLLGRAMPKNFYNTGSTAIVLKEIAKIMFEKNYIAMLTNAIADLHLNFPNSRRAVKYILRPLKLLTETAIELSQTGKILIAPGTTEDEAMSAASSVSDIDMDREDTPDLIRNSTLGILDPGRGEDHSSESEDDGEEIYESGYDDEMDFDEEIDRDDDEVVSDEDEELDDAGPLEGLSGDHPMDVEVIIDGEDDDDDDNSDDEDSEEDSEDDGMDDDDGLDIFQEFSEGDEEASHEGAEDEWEDEDEDGRDGHGPQNDGGAPQTLQEALDEERDTISALIGSRGTNDLGTMQQVFNHMTGGRDQSAEPTEVFSLGAGRFGGSIRPIHRLNQMEDRDQLGFEDITDFTTLANPDEGQDEDDEDEDGEDEDLEPDYEDEGDAPPWGLDDADELVVIPPPRLHHHHHHHHHWEGGRRNPWTVYNPDEGRGLLPGYRQHGRSAAESRYDAAAHPLLQRTQLQPQSSQEQTLRQRDLPINYTDFLSMLARDRRSAGDAMNLINSMIGAMGAGGVLDFAGRDGTLHVQIQGRGGSTVLPFDPSNVLRLVGPPPPRQHSSSTRQPRHYDHSLVPRFMPGRTIQRWRFEAMMLGGVPDYVKRAQSINKAIEKALVPALLEETRLKKIEERKAKEEEQAREEAAQKKAEEERLAKEKAEQAEKEAQEQREHEVKEAAEREAASRASEAQETEEIQNDGSMQGIETQAPTDANPEVQESTTAEPDQPRMIATFRGREVDISGLGIDLEYLDALPDELREEVLMQQLAEQRSQAAATGQDGDEISPEFLAALPEDIRQELLQQEARERRRREHAEARRRAQANGQAPRAEDMDTASFLASLDPTLRASVLVDQGEDILDHLPPAIAAEARALGADRARYFNGSGPARIHHLRMDPGFVRDDSDETTAKKHKRQMVQMLDKAGVATLLRLLFISQQGNGKEILNDILRNISLNRQNRAEVIGLLLVILQEGSVDAAAVEKSFAQLTLRARQPSSIQRTPLKRTNTGSQNPALVLDMSPASIIQQCLSTLVFLTRENIHVPSFFLTESEGFAKSKAIRKVKSKDIKASKFALNSLLSLLDRSIILDSAGCMEQLSTLLQYITHPLTILTKKDKKGVTSTNAEKETDDKAETLVSAAIDSVPASNDSPTGPETDSTSAPRTGPDTESNQKEDDPVHASHAEDSSKKQRNLTPPVVPEENLRLVVGILAARECSAKTFRDTVTTISNLSAIPGAKDVFGQELITQAQNLGQLISGELDELIPQVQGAKNSTDAQAVPAMTKFAAPAADQAKLLRVLTALDYLFDPKRNTANEDTQAGSSKTVGDTLAGLYESAAFGPLWQKLSDCLAAMKDKKHVLNVATILLPLIESLMVICKNTATKGMASKPAKDIVITSPEPETLAENLFFRFTEEHRKILNELVRHNPRLMSGTFSLLVKNPKVLEFDNKRNYFTRRLHSRGDQRRSQPPLNLPVRRDFTFSDSFQALYFKSPDEIKYGKLNIRFRGEEGVDAGGVTREWFQVMSRQMFNEGYALFSPVASDRTTFHPNKDSHINEPHLMWFKFIGRIIGKALYEGRALDCYFSRAVYKKILGKQVSVKDMESLDLEYYKSLIWMLENDITELIDQTFSVENEAFGVTEVVDLIPDGRNIAVTEENKQEYVQLIVEYRLIGSVKEQLDHFLEGFNDIVPAELINIFNEQELELLISGLPEIDVEDWKNHTDYHQYTISSPQIQWFWRAVRSFDKEERAKLLQFVTGTSKVPLNGFSELEGMNGFTRFNIHRDYGNKERLPSSHTCFNQLDLPEYESYEILRQRLYTAITTGSDYFGFA